MAKFRIQPHARLQEWIAEEKGYFKDADLDYDFVYGPLLGPNSLPTVQAAALDGQAPANPPEVRRGAYENYQEGRPCEISSACHWAVSQASATGHGLMWGHAYSVTPSGIYVPPESPIRTSNDLRGVAVAVGFHSGSHFSALQTLEKFLNPEDVNLQFVGGPNDRVDLLLDRSVAAANVFASQLYVVEQQGFRKIVDTTFMIGFLFSADSDLKDVEGYFNAMRRAQQDIDRDLGLYKHYYLRELPPRFHDLVDVQAFGPGERLVFEPYSREMYESTHSWMYCRDLFPEQDTRASYETAVVA